MGALPTLDAHAHLDPARPALDFAESAAVLSMTFSLEGATQALSRDDELVAWGVGCHPRMLPAQQSFDPERFGELVTRTAIIGEVGLDASSRVALKHQLRVFRQILDVVKEFPRLVSIHSYRAAGLALKELQRTPIAVPVLHGWTGTAAETQEAVALGCYFSIHSQVARHSRFRSWVPLDRLLIESDHGVEDPPAAIPACVQWVEYLVAQQYKIEVNELRKTIWQNFARIIDQTNTRRLLPKPLAEYISEALTRKR
ncbi:MAG: TatD family hydrolase [Anaerolineales bacterium]